MKRKKLYSWITLLTLCVCSCNNKEVNFSYSPSSPRAGQKVVFSNLTKEGESWVWEFGDGSQSSLKSPTKTYKKPGIYVVTLTADSSKHRRCAKEITILDTVPTFSVSTDSVVYREEITLQALVYNPYNKSLSYQWNLPECINITKGSTSEANIQLYFTQPDTTVSIELLVTLDGKEYPISQSVYIYDGEASSLLMASENGIYRQRVFSNGTEAPTLLSISEDKTQDAGELLVDGDFLYILQATSASESAIYRFDLQNKNISCVIQNTKGTENNSYSAGFLNKESLYWGSKDALYCISSLSENLSLNSLEDYRLADVSKLSSMTSGESKGLSVVGNMLFWSTGKGICHFSKDLSVANMLLATKDIQRFAIDAVSRKIYTIIGNTLCVCNFDGSYMNQIAADATGALTINNATSRLYYTTSKGIAYLPLVQTQNNQTIAEPTLLNEMTHISALAIDNTKRKK